MSSAYHQLPVSEADVPIELDSSSGRWIFDGCLFFEIGSSSADFLDLEQCRKDRRQETVRLLADSLWK